jgi:hypothetical protein
MGDRILPSGVSVHDRIIKIIDDLFGSPSQEPEPGLAEPFPLEKDQIVLRKAIEKSEVLFHRSWVKAHRGFYPSRLEVRKVLKHPITAGRDLIALNKKKNLHLPFPVITKT